MRKLIFILCLLPLFVQAQFGWSGLSSNQWVSFLDAQSSGIYQKQPLPSIPQWMSRQEALYYLDIDPTYLPVDGNKWITKPQLVANPTSGTVNWSYNNPLYRDGDYMTVTRNGEYVLSESSLVFGSGYFTFYDGDVIVITANCSNTGRDVSVHVTGDNGLEFLIDTDASNNTVTLTFTWRTMYHTTTITGILHDRTVDPPYYYYNVNKKGFFWKNNCGDGYYGSLVVYEIPANTFASLISVENANWIAQDEINKYGQDYANTNGYCTLETTTHRVDWVFNQNGYAQESVLYTIMVNSTQVINGNNFSGRYYNGSFTVSDGDIISISCANYSGQTLYRSAGIQTEGNHGSAQQIWHDNTKIAYASYQVVNTDGRITIIFCIDDTY